MLFKGYTNGMHSIGMYDGELCMVDTRFLISTYLRFNKESRGRRNFYPWRKVFVASDVESQSCRDLYSKKHERLHSLNLSLFIWNFLTSFDATIQFIGMADPLWKYFFPKHKTNWVSSSGGYQMRLDVGYQDKADTISIRI